MYLFVNSAPAVLCSFCLVLFIEILSFPYLGSFFCLIGVLLYYTIHGIARSVNVNDNHQNQVFLELANLAAITI